MLGKVTDNETCFFTIALTVSNGFEWPLLAQLTLRETATRWHIFYLSDRPGEVGCGRGLFLNTPKMLPGEHESWMLLSVPLDL